MDDEVKVLLQKRKHSKKYIFDYAAKIQANNSTKSIFYGGAVGTTKKDAKFRAVFEVLERYGSSLAEKPISSDSISTLREKAIKFIHPEDLTGFSDEQYSTPLFPYKKLNDTDVIDWVFNEKGIAIPARAVYFGYSSSAQPLYMPSTTCGTALHKTFLEAEANAIKELVERDAAMRFWLSRSSPDCYNLKRVQDGVLRRLINQCEKDGLKVHLWDITHLGDLPCFLAALISKEEPCVTFGLSAEFNFSRGAKKAILEALMVRNSLDIILHSPNFFRIKHAYNVKTFMDHAIYYIHEYRRTNWDFLFDGEMKDPFNEKRITICDYVKSMKEDNVITLDITPKSFIDLNYYVVRAISTVLYPMNVRHDCGYERRNKNLSGFLNDDPHPFG